MAVIRLALVVLVAVSLTVQGAYSIFPPNNQATLPNINGATNWTYSLWVKTPTWKQESGVMYNNYITNGAGVSMTGLYTASAQGLMAAHNNNGAVAYPQPATNAWVHLALTASYTNRLVLYINGVANWTNTAMLAPLQVRGGIQLGDDYGLRACPTMLVDDVRTYRRGLTSSEVLTLFASRGSDSILDCSRYRFTEGSGTNALVPSMSTTNTPAPFILTASSRRVGYGIEELFNAATAPEWSLYPITSPTNTWLQLDFGTSVPVSGIQYRPYVNYSWLSTYVLTSMDSATWVTNGVVTYNAAAYPGEFFWRYSVLNSRIVTRYIRLVGITSQSASEVDMYSVQFARNAITSDAGGDSGSSINWSTYAPSSLKISRRRQ